MKAPFLLPRGGGESEKWKVKSEKCHPDGITSHFSLFIFHSLLSPSGELVGGLIYIFTKMRNTLPGLASHCCMADSASSGGTTAEMRRSTGQVPRSK